MNDTPLVSVLLPTRNRAALMARALTSIQCQTLREIEIVVLDDGSTDETKEVLKAAARLDLRLRVFHGTGTGAATALNYLAREAQSPLLAIMHDDDIALPTRLEKQLSHIRTHELDVCGTWYRRLSRIAAGIACPPVDDDTIKLSLYFQPPILHPSVIMRREALERVGGYDASFAQAAEDYDLWARLAIDGARFGNVPEVLMQYRLSPIQASRIHCDTQTNLARTIRARYLAARGVPATPEQIALHVRVREPKSIESLDELYAFEGWLLTLREHFSNRPLAAAVIAQQWLFIGCRAAGLGMRCWREWRASPLAAATAPKKTALLLALCAGRVRYRSPVYRLLEPFAPA